MGVSTVTLVAKGHWSKLYVFFSSCTKDEKSARKEGRRAMKAMRTHLGVELLPDHLLVLGLDEEVVFVEVFNNEGCPLVHDEEDLLDCRVAVGG